MYWICGLLRRDRRQNRNHCNGVSVLIFNVGDMFFVHDLYDHVLLDIVLSGNMYRLYSVTYGEE